MGLALRNKRWNIIDVCCATLDVRACEEKREWVGGGTTAMARSILPAMSRVSINRVRVGGGHDKN